MSLVHEALEKAKRESASRTAKQLGLPETLAATAQPYRAPRGWHSRTIVLGLALLAVALVASALLWRTLAERRLRPADPPAAEVTEAPARAAAAGQPPPAVALQALTPQAASAPVQPSPSATVERAAFAAHFVRQVTLETGVVVRLGGIAWSEAAPLAYLNGRLLAVGESVEGLRVERIERDRVALAGAGVRLTLTLR